MLKDVDGGIVPISSSLPECGEDGTKAIVYNSRMG